MTILITGGSGRLGSKLKLIINAHTPNHEELDITDSKNIYQYIKKYTIDTIIHCAALTSIRSCELNHEKAFNINVNGVRNLCRALFSYNPDAYFIYVSTACVFSGDDPDHFYTEDDIPYPKNFYGLTKFIGEIVVDSFSTSSNTLIIRTNFIVRGKWPYPAAFTDRYANYLYSDQVAEKIKQLMEEGMTGLIHIYGDTRKSMYEFARFYDKDVRPISFREYSGPPLTANMCLTSKIIPPVYFSKG